MRSAKRLRLGGVMFVAALSLGAGSARAQTPDAKSAAQALFDEGQRLMTQGKFAVACAKFVESERLDHALGTMLNIADCYEKSGRFASAWGMFRDVVDSAHAAGDAREAYARRRMGPLEPKLSKLTIAAPNGAIPAGMEIKLDGVVVGQAVIGVPVPIDPGDHTIEVSAPGRRTWSTNARVEPEASQSTVTIPALEATPAQEPPPPAPPPSIAPLPSSTPTTPEAALPNVGAGRRVSGVVVGGVGLLGVGVGTIFGLVAKSKNDEALTHCRTSTLCDATGLALTDDAKSSATVSTVSFIVGGVALVGGAVLFLTAPKRPVAGVGSVRVAPAVGQRSAGIIVGGVW